MTTEGDDNGRHKQQTMYIGRPVRPKGPQTSVLGTAARMVNHAAEVNLI